MRRFAQTPGPRLRQRWIPCTLLATCLAWSPGCESTKSHRPAAANPAVLAAATPVQAWLLREKQQTVGALVRFEEAGTGRFLYSVRDGYGYDRGVVDSEGRAWRYRPHSEPEWTSSGTVLAGAGLILDLSTEPSMQETDLESLPAVLEASLRR